ncbi:MAG: hypothetical protein K2M06_06910 [Muribaculaceae bacterium]|nr:hypothetical protein [Muribaculaceae bacterium]
MKIKEVLDTLGEVFVPRVCKVCGRTLGEKEGRLLCLGCYLELPRTGMHTVEPSLSRGGNAVQERLADGPPLALAGAWFYYSRNSAYASLIRKLKYNDRPRWGIEMGELYGQELLADIPDLASRIDVLLPVGMHWRKEWRRGYNQSALLAEGIGSVAGVPVGDNLVAVRGHATQTRRSADERRRNVSGLFEVVHPEEVRGLHGGRGSEGRARCRCVVGEPFRCGAHGFVAAVLAGAKIFC